MKCKIIFKETILSNFAGHPCSSLEDLQKKCDADPKCKAISYLIGNPGWGCYKYATHLDQPQEYRDYGGCDTYVKNA
jgi:hypothetical protein